MLTVIDCGSLQFGVPMTFKNLVEGDIVKCSASSAAIYRYANKQLQQYGNPSIYSSWSASTTVKVINNCQGIPVDPPLKYLKGRTCTHLSGFNLVQSTNSATRQGNTLIYASYNPQSSVPFNSSTDSKTINYISLQAECFGQVSGSSRFAHFVNIVSFSLSVEERIVRKMFMEHSLPPELVQQPILSAEAQTIFLLHLVLSTLCLA